MTEFGQLENGLRQALVLGKQFAGLLGREGRHDMDAMQERRMLRGPSADERPLLSRAGPGFRGC